MLGTIFTKLISMVMVLIFILSILMLVLTFRKPKKISLPSLAITLGISLLSMVAFSAIIGYSPSFGVWLLMALMGGTIGYFWAKTTDVYIEGGQVKSQNSIWYLAVWGAVFALNQLITITTNRPPPIAMAMLVMSTFIIWGTNGNIIRRYFSLQPALAGQTSLPSPPVLPGTFAEIASPNRNFETNYEKAGTAGTTPPSFTEQAEWFIGIDGEIFGPHSREQLKEMIATASLKPGSLVWKKGMSDWMELNKIDGLI